MSSTTAFALASALLLALARPLSAQDWEGIAAASGRSQDGVFENVIATTNLDIQLAVCRGLARRADSDVQQIIRFLREQYSPGTAAHTELLLRWLLHSARSSHPAEQDLRAWIGANADAVNELLADMDRFRSPMLGVELVDLAVIAGGAASGRAIMEAGARTAARLRDTGGLLSSEETALALAFLAAAGSGAYPDTLPLCADIAREAQDGDLVKGARAAGQTAGRSAPSPG